ncbi:hypothetical protein R4518_15700 (plasmid) [Listeria monocytogenes]|nr:hypothetical protein R4518_15700 [Listeria monocytogenes]
MIVARKWPLALFLVIVTMFVFFQPKPVAAATAEAWGPYSWTDPGGATHTTALIKINGVITYCINPDLPAPYGGITIMKVNLNMDQVIRQFSTMVMEEKGIN